jgi:hypothetical protein
MNENTTPNGTGQQTDSTPSDPITEILAALRQLGTRLDVTERRLEHIARAEGLDLDELNAIGSETKLTPVPVPGLATRCDGKFLLNVAYLDGAKLEGRERWEGVVLEDDEAAEAKERLSGAGDDAAAHVAGRLIAAAKDEGDGEK